MSTEGIGYGLAARISTLLLHCRIIPEKNANQPTAMRKYSAIMRERDSFDRGFELQGEGMNVISFSLHPLFGLHFLLDGWSL